MADFFIKPAITNAGRETSKPWKAFIIPWLFLLLVPDTFAHNFTEPPEIILGQNFNIPEEKDAGFIVGTVLATEYDISKPLHSWNIEYNIDPNNNNMPAFSINPNSGELVVNDPADTDRELNEILVLTISVMEGGLVSEAVEVTITFTDINDNAPFFTTPDHETFVMENTPGLEIIFQVGSDDLDEGLNQEVNYNLEENGSENYFQINTISGEIAVVGSLDYESTNQHLVIIKAYDQGTPPNTTSFELTVNILNENEFIPVAMPDPAIEFIEDEINILDQNTLLANDQDGDMDSMFIEIIQWPVQGTLSLNEENLYEYRGLKDYNGMDSMVYRVSDGNFQSSPMKQYFEITPVNDPPKIVSVSNQNIRENLETNTLIGYLQAEDVENDQVTGFELISDGITNHHEVFYLNDSVLLSNIIYNYEKQKTYPIKIRTFDEYGAYSDTTLVIYIDDLPEAELLFIPNLFTPNQDGKNDVFRIRGDEIATIRFSIFNNKGELLYWTDDVQQALEEGWNGNYNGKEAPTGIYTWQISGKFLDGNEVQFKGRKVGNVSLIR